MASEFETGDDIFTCRQCGECCKGFGGTYVTDRDIGRIAAYIHCDVDRFADRHCQKSGSRLVLACGLDGWCVFYDPDRQCTIHPVKPYMCRAWPFIRAVIRYPENWNAMAGSCPGIKKEVPADALRRIVAREKAKLDQLVSGN